MWLKLMLLFIMYTLQTINIGFTWTLLPMLMRQQGLSLSEIGFSALIYIPWAIKFLYAPVVDRWYIPAWGRRKSWFGPLLLLSCAGISLLALFNPLTQFGMILTGVFFLNLLSATTDIAVDGYSTDILHCREMPWGNSAQMVGNCFGFLLGSSVFLIIYEQYGWSGTLLVMTALYGILSLPVLLHREIEPVAGKRIPEPDSAGTKTAAPSALKYIKTEKCRSFFLFLTFSVIIIYGGKQLRLPMLIDKGLNPADVGSLLLFFGTPVNMLGALIGGALIARLGESKVYILGCFLGGIVSLWTVWVNQFALPAVWMVALMFALDYMVMGLMMVLTYNMIMRLSAGFQAATRFAVLCSAYHTAMFGITAMTGIICNAIGYTAQFAVLAGCCLLFIRPGLTLINTRILTFHVR